MASPLLSALTFANVDTLPTTASKGDALILNSSGVLYVYDGSQWNATNGGVAATSLDDVVRKLETQFQVLVSIDASLKVLSGRV